MAAHHRGGMVICGCLCVCARVCVGMEFWNLSQDIQQHNARVVVHWLKLKGGWLMKQGSDPKPPSKCTTKWLQTKEHPPCWVVLIEPQKRCWSQICRCPNNMSAMKQLCKDEWSKVSPEHCWSDPQLQEMIKSKSSLTFPTLPEGLMGVFSKDTKHTKCYCY